METNKLSEVESKLRLIARALSNGHLDMDTRDELAREAYQALSLITDYQKSQLPSNVVPLPTRVTVYEPPHAA